jgi:methionine synthase II (cobalamin-independent)
MHRPPTATGIGSLPGTDTGAAHRLVFAELPALPHLPELPGRGVGADMIGRGIALLVDLYAEVQPSGWRLADRPGRDHRRAESFLRQDLDFLEENTQGYEGPLKLQAVGPWTLAATIELHYGDRMLADIGAARELSQSLTEGLRRHIAEVQQRVPGAQILLQLDEPALPGVLRGTVPTASGFGRLNAVEEAVARETLRDLIDAVGVEVAVHCCAPGVPFELLRRAGVRYLSFDASAIDTPNAQRDEQLGEAVEAGLTLMLGLVPSVDPPVRPNVTSLLQKIRSLTRLGFGLDKLAEAVVVTPTCGLAGATPPYARQALVAAQRTAEALADAAA